MTGITDIGAGLSSWPDDETPLIGVFESPELEFKMTAYILSKDAAKAEFAKDVAGMANAGGGVIVLGIETDRDAAVGRDKSVRIRPIASGVVDLGQMEEVARTWIYPPQRSLEVREWPDSKGQVLVSIRVPGFSDLGGLAIILGPGDPPDRRTVGVPVRSESRVDFHSASEIYDWIRRGRLQGEARVVEPEPESERDADTQRGRVLSEFVDAAPTGEAVLFLQAWPIPTTRLERIHDHDGVRGLFLDPPPHRWGAFGWWGLQPEVDTGGGLRVSSGQVSLWVTPSAVATLVITQDYLAWAMERYSSGAGPLINPTALGEFIYEFCRTYLLILGWSEPRPDRASFRLGVFRALEPLPLRLGSGGPEAVGYASSARSAPSDELIEVARSIDISERPGRAEEIAALLIRRFYGLFGFGRENIPHLTDNGGRFDPESLQRQARR